VELSNANNDPCKTSDELNSGRWDLVEAAGVSLDSSGYAFGSVLQTQLIAQPKKSNSDTM